MPFISTEEVKTKRTAVKKALPEYKFSIRKKHHSSISVTILSGPIQLLSADYIQRGYEDINHFYYKEHFANEPEKLEVLTKIIDIIREGNHIVSEDGDYGSIPNFYTDVSIGAWDKSYQVK